MASTGARVRVVTWNLGWRRAGWRSRQAAIHIALQSVAPNVLTVQAAWRGDEDSQVEGLSEALGLPHVAWSTYARQDILGTVDSRPDLRMGIGVLSKWPFAGLQEVRSLPAAGQPDGGRTALGVVIDHPSAALPVVTTHLMSHPAGSAARVRQAATVVKFAAHVSAGVTARAEQTRFPVVVTGDMNAVPSSDEMRKLGGLLTEPVVPGFVLADCWDLAGEEDPGWTWFRNNPWVGPGHPNARIDYVLVGMDGSKGLGRVTGRGLLGDGPVATVWPSSHAGVWVDLSVA